MISGLKMNVMGEEKIQEFDLQKVNVDLIKNQTIKFDIRSFYSIYSTSFNFSSNNHKIALPGLRPSSFNRKYCKKEKFNYHKMIIYNDHFFMIDFHKKEVKIHKMGLHVFNPDEVDVKKKLEEDEQTFTFTKVNTSSINRIIDLEKETKCNDLIPF